MMRKALPYVALVTGVLAFAYTCWIQIFTARPCGQSTFRWEVLAGTMDKGATPFLTRSEVAPLPEPVQLQYEEAARHAAGLAEELRLMLYASFIISTLVVVLASQML